MKWASTLNHLKHIGYIVHIAVFNDITKVEFGFFEENDPETEVFRIQREKDHYDAASFATDLRELTDRNDFLATMFTSQLGLETCKLLVISKETVKGAITFKVTEKAMEADTERNIFVKCFMIS